MNDSTAPNEQFPSESPKPTARKRRLFPSWWFWILAALAIAAIIVLQTTDLTQHRAMANVNSVIIAFVLGMVFMVWFILFSGYLLWVRLCIIAVLLAYGGYWWYQNRIEIFSGNMWPVFVSRWMPRPGEGMELPKTSGKDVDLATTTEHDFSQFLGSNRNLAVDNVKLNRDWSKHPPKLIWKQRIGAGWSAFAVVNGYAVTIEQRDKKELVTCYDVKTGKPQWAWSHDARYATLIAGTGPRSTPTIHDGKVYAQGATGVLVCLDGANGKLMWKKDLRKVFGITDEQEAADLAFGRSGSPLIVGGLVVVPAGGAQKNRVSLVAFDKETGKLKWKGGDHQLSYSSPVLAKLAGNEQIVIVNQAHVSGHDPQSGKVLWEFDWPGHSSRDANCSQAVPVSSNSLFVSKGYAQGASLVEFSAIDDESFTPKKLWHNRRVMRTKYTNVTVHDGHVYGLSDGILECVELKTGKQKWKDGRYNHGQILRINDLLLVISEEGQMILVEATPEKSNHVLGYFQAIDGTTWNNIALYGKYLLVRNAQEAACYELKLE